MASLATLQIKYSKFFNFSSVGDLNFQLEISSENVRFHLMIIDIQFWLITGCDNRIALPSLHSYVATCIYPFYTVLLFKTLSGFYLKFCMQNSNICRNFWMKTTATGCRTGTSSTKLFPHPVFKQFIFRALPW